MPAATYHNPVFNHACPDPFVLKVRGAYWAYCSGIWHDGRCFGVLHSPDLVTWQDVGGALTPLPGDHPCYWAPEVSILNGRFYLYYSVGNETRMELRVGVADRPEGPFVDSGHRLTTEDFAIDAHVFTDDDGRRYLFYATDFLDHSHIGTGTVVDRLLDPFTLAGQPRPVTRARFDWQVYDPHRAEKGGVRWHTVEGSFVLKRKGRYYHMFSGGNWQNVTYGVGYAVTDDINTPDEWEQVCDGQHVLPILRTIPGQVVGPGHNSVVRGPDNRQLFCVYHRWADDASARVMCIDRLEWVGERLTVLGPSTSPQPAPLPPTIQGFGADGGGLGPDWETTGGEWRVEGGQAAQTSNAGSCSGRRPLPASSFTLELGVRALADPSGRGGYGLSLYTARGPALALTLLPGSREALVAWHGREGLTQETLTLPAEFEAGVDHLVRLTLDGGAATLSLDDIALRWQGWLDVQPTGLALRTLNMSAAFTSFELTVGWEDLFDHPAASVAALGWESIRRDGPWTLAAGELCYHGSGEGTLVKGLPLPAYELVVNACLDPTAAGSYGFYPAVASDGTGLCLRLVQAADGWALVVDGGGGARWPLPEFDPHVYQQFRFRKGNGRLVVQWEAQPLGEMAVSAEPTRVGLWARGKAAFEMVRVTAMPDDL